VVCCACDFRFTLGRGLERPAHGCLGLQPLIAPVRGEVGLQAASACSGLSRPRASRLSAEGEELFFRSERDASGGLFLQHARE